METKQVKSIKQERGRITYMMIWAGLNLYTYCYNNPIMFDDPNGNDPGDRFKTPDEGALDFARIYNEKSIKKGKF